MAIMICAAVFFASPRDRFRRAPESFAFAHQLGEAYGSGACGPCKIPEPRCAKLGARRGAADGADDLDGLESQRRSGPLDGLTGQAGRCVTTAAEGPSLEPQQRQRPCRAPMSKLPATACHGRLSAASAEFLEAGPRGRTGCNIQAMNAHD
eukprot:g27376.t1